MEHGARLRRVAALGPRGRGSRMPPDLRDDIIAYARERLADGAALKARTRVRPGLRARRSGTGCACPSAERGARALVPVAIVPGAVADAVVVVSLRGYRVEGSTFPGGRYSVDFAIAVAKYLEHPQHRRLRAAREQTAVGSSTGAREGGRAAACRPAACPGRGRVCPRATRRAEPHRCVARARRERRPAHRARTPSCRVLTCGHSARSWNTMPRWRSGGETRIRPASLAMTPPSTTRPRFARARGPKDAAQQRPLPVPDGPDDLCGPDRERHVAPRLAAVPIAATSRRRVAQPVTRRRSSARARRRTPRRAPSSRSEPSRPRRGWSARALRA